MRTLVCRIELNKEKGVLLTVETGDDKNKITQTLVMDGTSITTTVKGSKETSTIIQKPDSITMKCNTFTLDADTITCKSKKETLHESGENFDIKSGKNFDIKSGNNVGVAAKSAAAYKAEKTTLESTSKSKIKGDTLVLSGSNSAELKGANIKLDSKGFLNLITTGAATLEGSKVDIKGKLNM